MKKINVIVLTLLLLAFLFTGCEETSSADSTVYSDEDIANIAMAAIGSNFISFFVYLEYAFTDKATMESNHPGLTITEGSSAVTFLFDNVEYDLDGDDITDAILNGSFSVADYGSSGVITFSSFSIVVASEGISPTFSGTLTISSSVYAIDLTISGIVSNTVTVILELTVVNGEPTGVSIATINGVDYTEEFQAVFESTF